MNHPHDTEIVLNGNPCALRLTLGALAAIEEHFGGDLDTLRQRLERPKVGDIVVILHALLMGGGTQLTLSALKNSDVDLTMAARAIAAAFAALPGEDAPAETPGKPLRSTPQRVSGARER